MDTLAEYAAEVRRLSELIDKGIAALRDAPETYADAENAYRHARAQAWVTVPREHDGQRLTAAEREATVDAVCAEQRRCRDIAEGQVRAAREAVRARQGQLSAVQSLLNAHRSEADFDRTAPR